MKPSNIQYMIRDDVRKQSWKNIKDKMGYRITECATYYLNPANNIYNVDMSHTFTTHIKFIKSNQLHKATLRALKSSD